MRESTAEWVAKAENDFAVAQRALGRKGEEPPIADAVCFHGQQCAEKYLKAFLQEGKIRFERTHALLPLLKLCLSSDPAFEQLTADLNGLQAYAVAARYPGVNVTPQMAEEALASAARVRAFVRAKLGPTDPSSPTTS